MICPNPRCKAAIPDGMVFCPSCGEHLSPTAAARTNLPPDAAQMAEADARRRRRFRRVLSWVFAILFVGGASAGAIVYREQLKEVCHKIFPPVCNVHPGVRLDANGNCPKVCETCRGHLDAEGRCPNVCAVHGVHLDENGDCPKACETCKGHLDAEGRCPKVCAVHGVHLDENGNCPKVCETCRGHLDAEGRCPKFCAVHSLHLDENGDCPKACETCKGHLDAEGRCPKVCAVHGVHLDENGNCPKVCKVCGKHLEKDAGNRCEDTCDKHPKIHLIKGLCRWCNPPYDDLDERVRVHKETERDGRFYPEFCVTVGNGVSTGRSDLNWILDDNDVGHGDTVSDGTSHPDGSPRKIWIWAPQEGFAPDETHVIQAITWRSSPDGPLLSRARPYIWTKKKCEICGKPLEKDGGKRCPDTCDKHPGTHLDKDGKCPECVKNAEEQAIQDALEAFRAKKWKEGQDALAGAKIPEPKLADAELRYYLGLCREDGLGGVDKDFQDALRWYRKSAEQGHVEAQYRLGFKLVLPPPKYDHLKDVEEGRKWLEKAAAQGHKMASDVLKDL